MHKTAVASRPVARALPEAPRISTPRISAPPPATRSGALIGVYLAAVIVVAGTIAGSSYYFAPVAERVRSPLHPWLRPSGYIGQTAGIVAFLIFIFLWLYPLRKRYRWLAWTGVMSRWLDSHVALALVIPFITAIHAAWRFTGVIGLGFWSVMVVYASGIVGPAMTERLPERRCVSLRSTHPT